MVRMRLNRKFDPAQRSVVTNSKQFSSQLISVYFFGFHLVAGIGQFAAGGSDLQLSLDPVGLVEVFYAHAHFTENMHDLVRRWWWHVDARAVVGDQQELGGAAFF